MAELINEPRWVAKDSIEAKAEALLREYTKGAPIRPPVPVRDIVEGHFDLTIDWCQIHEKPHETILACIDPQEREIRMNERHRDYFDRYFGTELFTLAHEVGHWVLHVQDSEGIQLAFGDLPLPKPFVCRAQGSLRANSFEWQANQFAAALVMPESLLREQAGRLDLCVWRNLYDLKEVFGVTVSALKNRLVDLKIIYADGMNLFPSYEAFSGQGSLL